MHLPAQCAQSAARLQRVGDFTDADRLPRAGRSGGQTLSLAETRCGTLFYPATMAVGETEPNEGAYMSHRGVGLPVVLIVTLAMSALALWGATQLRGTRERRMVEAAQRE
jgi:hypothetical protein